MQCKIFNISLFSLLSLITFSLWSATPPEKPFWVLYPPTETVGIAELSNLIKKKHGIPTQEPAQAKSIPTNPVKKEKETKPTILNSHNAIYYSMEDLEKEKELLDQALKDAPEDVQGILSCYQDKSSKTNTLFLFGPPGTGKTTLGMAAARFLKRPCVLLDCANTATKYKASGPENLRNVILPLIEESTEYAVILDEVTTLTNGKGDQNDSKESAAGVWKILDRCIKAAHIFFILTTNHITEAPKQLKDRLFHALVKIAAPNNSKFAQALVLYCKKLNIAMAPDVENYLLTNTMLTFDSFRQAEGFADRLLRKTKYKSKKNGDTQVMLSKECIDLVWHEIEELIKETGYNDPNLSETERLHEDNKNFQREMQKKSFQEQREIVKRQEEFQLLAQERQELYANNQSTENMIMQSTSSIPLVGSIIGASARNSYVAARKGTDFTGVGLLKSNHKEIKEKQEKHNKN